MTESEIKTLFLDIVGTLNLCRDVNMKHRPERWSNMV